MTAARRLYCAVLRGLARGVVVGLVVASASNTVTY